MEKYDAVKEFNARLLRRWAVETGLIERLYTLDRGIAQMLVERGLDASLISHRSTNGDPEYVIQLIRDQHDAVTGLFDFVASSRELGTSYIKELHAVLTENQGDVDAVDSMGRRVTVPHEAENVAPEVQAAWLHHRFTQIHPFQDGNGRVARALATLVLLKAEWFPLVIMDAQRDDYIDALKAADSGDLQPLVRLIGRVEKKAFVDALGAAAQAKQDASSQDAMIAVMRDTFEKRRRELTSEWDRAKDVAGMLQDSAAEKLDELARRLESELKPLAPPGSSFTFFADRNEVADQKSYWFRYQVVEVAKALGYFANISSCHAWARLVMRTEARIEILLSLHGFGHEYRGVLVGSICLYEEDPERDFVYPASNIVPLTDEPFQVNYKESEQAAAERFAEWLDQALVKGLGVAHKLL